jgi:hypothetical protein
VAQAISIPAFSLARYHSERARKAREALARGRAFLEYARQKEGSK